MNENGNAVTSDQSKADMFNNYYTKAGITDNGCTPACDIVSVSSIVETVRFTETDIITAINKLKPNLSSGPDNLPPLLFKKLKYILSYPLSLIFAQLLSVGCVPGDWTKAIITALHGMQSRYSDGNSVCPSVCPSVKRVHCDKTEESYV